MTSVRIGNAWVVGSIAILGPLAGACGRTSPGGPRVGDGPDGAARSDSAMDGGASTEDSAPVDDSGSPEADAGTNTFNDFLAAANWEAVDLATVAPGPQGVNYWGAVFVGSALYLDPYFAICARYDTTMPLAGATSWSSFAISSLNARRIGAGDIGGVTDGRYLFFSPGYGASTGTVPRYDTAASLGSTSSWSTFDTTTITAGAMNFAGAVFDGRRVYFVPGGPEGLPGALAIVARYDTTAPFADGASWGAFDLSAMIPARGGFLGGVFDGRFLYLVPQNGVVARYDTAASFADPSSWTVFALATAAIASQRFNGGVFDGRYLYLAPAHDFPLGAVGTRVVRYDTTQPFGAAGSWSSVDLASFTADYSYPGGDGFSGGAFDGRYLYLAPSESPFAARFDTTASFAEGSAWSFFDTAAIDRGAGAFNGAGFDGQYLYLVPGKGTVMVRFDARTVRAIPRTMYGGSFL
jgi:hypothetical protein